MKEHKYCIPFSIRSFENARRFRDAVESGDFSHDYGVCMADSRNSIGWYISRCLAESFADGACVRMQMPGLILLEHWTQAFALVPDPVHRYLWHYSWVDNEFIPADELKRTYGY